MVVNVTSEWPRRTSTALLFITAAFLVSSSTRLSWGGTGDLPDGTRFKVGPTTVVHVLQPHRPVSETIVCATDHRTIDPPGCTVAPGGELAERQIHAAWHALGIGVVLSGLAAILALAPPVVRRWLWILAAGIVGILAATVYVMATRPPVAFAALAGAGYEVGGTLAMMQVALTILLVAGAAVHAAAPFSRGRFGAELAALVGLAGLALLAFRFLDWAVVAYLLGPTAFGAHLALSRRLRTSPGS